MIVGLIIQAFALARLADGTTSARIVGFVAGAALVYGGVQWSRGRGYTPWLGFGAMLSFLGVGFLLMLPTDPRGKRLFGLAASKEKASDASA